MSDQLTIGDALKASGMARADETSGTSAWKARWDDAITQLARMGDPFTADDVREIAGPPGHPNAAGSRFLQAARRGVIHRVGFRNSSRDVLHSHPLSLWEGTDTATAPTDLAHATAPEDVEGAAMPGPGSKVEAHAPTPHPGSGTTPAASVAPRGDAGDPGDLAAARMLLPPDAADVLELPRPPDPLLGGRGPGGGALEAIA